MAIADAKLRQLELFATELARASGREAELSLARAIAFDFKTPGKGEVAPRDPVTEVDRRIEDSVRSTVEQSYPEHGFVGEEGGAFLRDRGERGFVWAVDPIDGTSNFLHRYPLFAVSIACLHDGDPVVGAVWCAASHALRPGVYHARRGGQLCFDGVSLHERGMARIQRPLLGTGGRSDLDARAVWSGHDVRVSGSAAIECAFVAADVLRGSRLAPLSVWDVAGGIALVRAAGKQVLVQENERWRPFERFEGPLLGWRRALAIGDEALFDLIASTS